MGLGKNFWWFVEMKMGVWVWGETSGGLLRGKWERGFGTTSGGLLKEKWKEGFGREIGWFLE